MSASAPSPHSASLRAVLESTAQLFRATVLKCLPLGMLAVLCAQLANVYWIAAGHPIRFSARHDLNYALLSLFGAVIELWLIGAMMLRQRAVVLGAPLRLAAELRAALVRLPSILASVLLAILSVAAGLVLLIAPGVFLLICYLIVLPIILFEGLGPYAALLRSVQLLRPLWGRSLAALVFALLAFLICALAFAAVISVLAGLLAARLLDAEQTRQQSAQAQSRKLQIGSGDRSERIRTYNFPQGRVTDHRINLTLYRLPEILDGALDELLQALSREYQAELLAAE